MKSIDTTYKGYRFRSRTEARWAVFFDSLGLRWTYEQEGYDLEGLYYLPDFWIEALDCWVEVKGDEPGHEEKLKAFRLSLLSHKPVLMCVGMPRVHPVWKEAGELMPQGYSVTVYLGRLDDRIRTSLIDEWVIESLQEDRLEWMAKEMRGFLLEEIWYTGTSSSIQKLKDAYEVYREKGGGEFTADWEYGLPIRGLVWSCTKKGDVKLSFAQPHVTDLTEKPAERLMDAHRAAQQARFEHGEKGV